MERLTERNPLWINDEMWLNACEPDDEEIEAIYRRLKDYEDLEEKGRLIKLPCKVRDIIYVVTPGCKTVKECKVITVNYSNTTTSGNVFYIETLPTTGSRAVIGFYNKDIGKTVFFTKSAAEAKLKEKSI